MTPHKLTIGIATFPYGGNGATAKEHPDVRNWLIDVTYEARNDPRIEGVHLADYCDTPITMTRNQAVQDALKNDVDVLVMVDSDQKPDMYLGIEPDATPFWKTAFDFLYDHWEKGPVCVGAPYLGGPPHENVFCFLWRNQQGDHPNTDADFQLSQYSREEAFSMRGIQPCAALPTGLIMFDTRIFALTSPQRDVFGERVREWLLPYQGQPLTPEIAEEFTAWVEREKYSREQSWFYYEYERDRDGVCYQSRKASTEDVTATRDLSLIGSLKLGYNPVHCAWSSWAGHWKAKCVGKPQLITVEGVSSKMARAAQDVRTETTKWMEAEEVIRLSQGRAPVEQPTRTERSIA